MLLPLAASAEDDRRQVVLVIACVSCLGNGTDDHFSYWQVVDVEVLCAACDFFRDGLLHLSQFQLLAAVVAVGTAAYLRYESADANTNSAIGKVTTYSAGMRHAF